MNILCLEVQRIRFTPPAHDQRIIREMKNPHREERGIKTLFFRFLRFKFFVLLPSTFIARQAYRSLVQVLLPALRHRDHMS
jgi:hypothetical protein